MKRRTLILLLSICLILATLTVIASVQILNSDEGAADVPTNKMDLIATSPYRVCSFDEYIYYGNPDKWLYPQAYVGAGAVFNIDYVDNYVIATKDEIENAEYVNPMAEDNFYDQFTSIDYTVVCNEAVGSIKVVVTDYVLNVTDAATMTGDLWFKVEAADGYTLPQELQDRPYVLCQTFYEDDRPALVFTHIGMFTGETVIFSKEAVAACPFQQLSVADLPKVFEVSSYILVESQDEDEVDYEFYDLGDVTAWETETKPNYQFVDIKYVELVPITVSYAYEQLTSAESCAEFYERLEEIPDQVLASFSQTLKEDVFAHVEALYAIEHAELHGNATVNGTELDVTVVGKIPVDTVELDVVPVADQDIIDGGFGIKSADEIIIALDIKIVSKEDGTEWQPEEGYPVELSIDVASLGYEDGKVVRLHHKHGDEIETCDYLLVENGKVTFVTSNFSIFLIKELHDVDGVKLSAGTTIDLEVGDDVLYYIDPPVGNNQSVVIGTWVVTDTTGAIHYTVYTEGKSTDIGNTRANARWINIVALKKTPGEPGGADEQLITLTYKYLVSTRTVNWRGEEIETISNTIQEETYKIRVKTPAATSANGGRRLYIKDMVNTTGCITAALVDTNGNEINDKLEGAAFEWTRSDKLFIVPQAYSGDLNDPNAANDFRSVNIARDHGGLVEARKRYLDEKDPTSQIGYKPVTYTLRATLSDGTVLTDSYTVYYQSEIINASFEFPKAVEGQHNFFPNGYAELYWKTTAPGSNAAKLTQDIEYGSVVNKDGAQYGVPKAADGFQFAEVNAEEFGALYQDIITVPGVAIDWDFVHAARQKQNNGVNSMYLVFGPTEQAQTLTTQDHLTGKDRGLGAAVKKAVANRSLYTKQESDDFYAGKLGVTIEYEYPDSGIKATYTVWYHTVDRSKNSGANSWVELKGEYTPPDGQYRTRVFFVTDNEGVTRDENYGNLLDNSSAGQFRTYLIEYYEESYAEDGSLVIRYHKSKDEKGRALIYSSKVLDNFTHFESTMNDYLHSILINNENYPYDIRYANTPSLYIEKYSGSGANAVKRDNLYDGDRFAETKINYPITNTNNYSDYDIVVQIFFRDTVIAVQKKLVLPTYMAADPNDPDSKEVPGLTDEQKVNLFKQLELTSDKGYKNTFTLNSSDGSFKDSETTLITQRDPAGNYTAYVALGDNPPLNKKYTVSELIPQNPTGLVLNKVTFIVRRYYMGASLDDLKEEISYETTEHVELSEMESVSANPIYLGDIVHNGVTKSVKIADVTVINEYVEKQTTIYYEAVGNGKVAIVPKDGEPNFQDTPTETLAFYSGKAVGADVFAGAGATFVGWYTDPECENPVELKDGVYDRTTGNFKPNSNIINADSVTFYAKFETNSVTIERTGGTPGQTYVYMVEGTDTKGTKTVMYATLTCGANGTGSTQILEAVSNSYKITEMGDWPWRSDNGVSVKKEQSFGSGDVNHIKVSFNGNEKIRTWSNGYSPSKKNVYSVSGGGSE